MTQVDFYILKQGDSPERLAFACRLTEKVYRLGHKVHINANREDVGPIDELLWQHNPASFLPHNIIGEGPKVPPPIQIGADGEIAAHNDLLINLCDTIPSNASRYRRIIEVVPPTERLKEVSRDNYRVFKKMGFAIKTHDIDNPIATAS